ncbi:MAG TPA: peptidase M2 family protein, partial [Myxococcus sp.]|nr:peptidase M2 family protein [Myxococcus sp.]
MNRKPSLHPLLRTALAAVALPAFLGCVQDSQATRETPATPEPVAAASQAATPAQPTPEEAKQFAEKLNADLKRLWTRQATAEWIKNTHITDDTERNAASINE